MTMQSTLEVSALLMLMFGGGPAGAGGGRGVLGAGGVCGGAVAPYVGVEGAPWDCWDGRVGTNMVGGCTCGKSNMDEWAVHEC